MRRPRYVLKAGVTLDGRICDAFGRSQWITGPQARGVGQQLRSRCDAILVGSGTLLADDPALNVRIDGGSPVRPVVLDSGLQCPADAKVLSAGLRPWLFCAPDAPGRALAADLIRVPRGAAGGLDLAAVGRVLWDRGVREVLVEGGGRVHRSLFDAGLVDELHLFIAPKVLARGKGWLAGPGIALADAPELEVVSVAMVGADVHLVLCRAVVTESDQGASVQR